MALKLCSAQPHAEGVKTGRGLLRPALRIADRI